jgi:uncharacterized protein YcbX
VIKAHDFSEGGKQISLGGKPDEGDLTAEEVKIVDLVADSYGRLDATTLGKLTKTLNTQLGAQVWGQNRRASVDEDAYARLSESYQAFSRRLQDLDFANEQDWSEPIDDPHDYLRRELLGG